MIRLINASAHDTGLDAQSVHCIVTSKEYVTELAEERIGGTQIGFGLCLHSF